jgi:hypothetical protein
VIVLPVLATVLTASPAQAQPLDSQCAPASIVGSGANDTRIGGPGLDRMDGRGVALFASSGTRCR